MTAAAQRIVPASSMSTEALTAAAWRAGDLSWKLDPHQLEIYDAFNAWNRRRHTPEYLALCQSIQGAMDSVWDEELCRRFGKTAKWIIQLDEIALQRPGAVLTYGTAFQKDIGDIIVPLQNLLAGDAPDDVRPRYRGSYGAYSSPVLHFPSTDSVIKLVGIDKNPDGLRGRFSDGIVISEARDVRQLEAIVRGILLPQFQRRPWAFLALESSTPKDLDHDLIRIFKPDATARGAYVMRTLDANKAISDTDREQYIREAGGRGHPECEREYFCKVTRDPERMIVPEFDREKHVRMVPRPAYAHCFVVLDPGMSDRLAILWGYWDWMAQMLVIERSWAEFNAGTDVVARVLKETEEQLWGRLPSSNPANDNAVAMQAPEGLVEVEPHSTDHDGIEALRETLRSLPGSPELSRRAGRWFVADGFPAYACEHQGYVRRIIRAAPIEQSPEAAYQAGAFLYWSPDKRQLLPNPLERWTDVDLRLAHDLKNLHGIHVAVIDKSPGSADADVQQMRLAMQNDQVCILPDTFDANGKQLTGGPLADELESGKRKASTVARAASPSEWERSPVYGHYDCLAALKYKIRKVWISRSRNPFPPEGALLNGEAVIREPWAEYSQQSRSAKALNAVFGGGRVRR